MTAAAKRPAALAAYLAAARSHLSPGELALLDLRDARFRARSDARASNRNDDRAAKAQKVGG